MKALRTWWTRLKWKRERRELEVYIFNYGPAPKWIQIRDENTKLGVWKGYPL